MPTNNHESTLQRATKEYKALYYAKFGVQVPDIEATKQALRFVNLFRLLLRDKTIV